MKGKTGKKKTKQHPSPLAKLTTAQAREVYRLSRRGWSQPRLAKRFRISQPAVYNLLSGKTYKPALAPLRRAEQRRETGNVTK